MFVAQNVVREEIMSGQISGRVLGAIHVLGATRLSLRRLPGRCVGGFLQTGAQFRHKRQGLYPRRADLEVRSDGRKNGKERGTRTP